MEGPGSDRCWAQRGPEGRGPACVRVKGQGLGGGRSILPTAPRGRPLCPPPLILKARGDVLRAVSCSAGQSRGSKAVLLCPSHPAGCRGDKWWLSGLQMPDGDVRGIRLSQARTHKLRALASEAGAETAGKHAGLTHAGLTHAGLTHAGRRLTSGDPTIWRTRREPGERPLPRGRMQPVFIHCAQTFFFFLASCRGGMSQSVSP